MKNKIFLFLILSFATMNISAQEIEGYYLDLGFEIQQYPAGFLLGVRSEVGLSPHNALDVRVGYNLLDHQNLGIHESEKGDGLGFSLGYRHYFKSNNKGFFLGFRSDLWWNEVDWKDNIGEANEIEGTSKVTVLQPTAIGGYRYLFSDHWLITPTVAFGAGINVKTEGVGIKEEGPVFLWGLNVAYRFY